MEIKNIRVDEETWWKLCKLKVDMILKRIADVIVYLLKKNKK